jgi:DNA-binding MarR family transcriptional regulator
LLFQKVVGNNTDSLVNSVVADQLRHQGITRAAATDLVDRLERAGHVERHRDTVDRRRVHLIPTSSALDLVAEELRPLIELLDAVVDSYSDAERDAVGRYLADVLGVYQHFAQESQVSE